MVGRDILIGDIERTKKDFSFLDSSRVWNLHLGNWITVLCQFLFFIRFFFPLFLLCFFLDGRRQNKRNLLLEIWKKSKSVSSPITKMPIRLFWLSKMWTNKLFRRRNRSSPMQAFKNCLGRSLSPSLNSVSHRINRCNETISKESPPVSHYFTMHTSFLLGVGRTFMRRERWLVWRKIVECGRGGSLSLWMFWEARVMFGRRLGLACCGWWICYCLLMSE